MRNPRTIRIVVEGSDGSGKTTLLNRLEKVIREFYDLADTYSLTKDGKETRVYRIRQ